MRKKPGFALQGKFIHSFRLLVFFSVSLINVADQIPIILYLFILIGLCPLLVTPNLTMY